VFTQIPHGRITAIFLPATIQFVANAGMGRYEDIARLLGLPADDTAVGAASLVAAIHKLFDDTGQPHSLQASGIPAADFEEALPLIVEHVNVDANTIMSPRIPDSPEIEKLLMAAYNGRSVEF
jgi:acetaldehyde dehydrogenase/alcohol dehydrogenase